MLITILMFIFSKDFVIHVNYLVPKSVVVPVDRNQAFVNC